MPATATDERKDVRDNLEKTDTELDKVATAVDNLDRLNQTAADKKAELNEQTADDEHMQNAVTNASKAAGKIEDIATDIETNNVTKAEAKAAEDAPKGSRRQLCLQDSNHTHDRRNHRWWYNQRNGWRSSSGSSTYSCYSACGSTACSSDGSRCRRS